MKKPLLKLKRLLSKNYGPSKNGRNIMHTAVRMDIDTMVDTFKQGLGLLKTDPASRQSELFYYELVIKQYEKILEAKSQGNPMALLGVLVPSELFYAIDIVPLYSEFHTLYATFLGSCTPYLDRASAFGVPVEL
jgi:hypothetical protein